MEQVGTLQQATCSKVRASADTHGLLKGWNREIRNDGHCLLGNGPQNPDSERGSHWALFSKVEWAL